MSVLTGYNLRSTLTYGDIYGQILIWLLVVFLSLASGLALMGAAHVTAGMVVVGSIFVFSLPFILFAFTTTLLNHIALDAVSQEEFAAHARGLRAERTPEAAPARGSDALVPGLL
ncbi:hypothetical protein [Cyanobium sp. NIES-981]|uniref:hypothetical protein n=1 Tax=Cyanobium sp. NIES-981 TaxID=1851505 RepID=UPI0007DDDF3D|nr:hypothetical protein [Cyanobium sp. NIES-981]SBO42850.1 protein of unknown function [Cyanobium sp. NIES-981]